MTYQEKGVWIYGALSVVVPAAYLVFIIGQIRSTPVTEIGYQIPMIGAVVATIALFILSSIVVAIAAPGEADKKDQRDREIDRYGELIGYYVISAGVMVALVLAMTKADHFWIANSMYAVGAVAAIVSSVAKIVAYRRGFEL